MLSVGFVLRATLRAPMVRKSVVLGATLAALCACDDRTSESPPPVEEPKMESTVHGTPVRQGYTQPPPPDAEWLPPLPPPFLTDAELASVDSASADEGERRAAREELLELLEVFEKTASNEVLRQLGDRARAHARAGRIDYRSIKELHRAYLFPNDVDVADRRYKDTLVVLTGRVAPPNMLDSADGFKLYRQEPQVHDPLLLETSYERAFVRCRLARPEEQKLRDWETVHVLGIVDGKQQSDVFLSRCIALTENAPLSSSGSGGARS